MFSSEARKQQQQDEEDEEEPQQEPMQVDKPLAPAEPEEPAAEAF